MVVSWPGEHQRDRLVPDLLVRELRTVLVGGFEKEPEDVEGVLTRRGAATPDLLKQDLIEDLS